MADTNEQNSWIQADFARWVNIQFIATQKRYADNRGSVLEYNLSYSMDGIAYVFIMDTDNIQPLVFAGNNPDLPDSNEIVEHELPFCVRTRFFKLHSLAYGGLRSALRWELYSCESS